MNRLLAIVGIAVGSVGCHNHEHRTADYQRTSVNAPDNPRAATTGAFSGSRYVEGDDHTYSNRSMAMTAPPDNSSTATTGAFSGSQNYDHAARSTDRSATSVSGHSDTMAPIGWNSADTRILSIMACADRQEIEAGRFAQQNASGSQAKQYADMLVNDHTEHARKVESTARNANIALIGDAEVQRLRNQEKGMAPDASNDPRHELENLKGSDFDRAFGRKMAECHQDMISTLEAARPNLQNSSVRSLVDSTLPVLRQHLTKARALADGAS